MRSSNTVKSIKKLSGALVGIPPRHINFQFPDSIPKYFYAGNATATTFFAMLSGFFPPGERYFMESVRHFRGQVKDESLRAAISGFMGQEAIHGREHDRLNQILAEYGYDMQSPDRFVKIGLAILEKLPPSTRLAATTFMEHFTALLAEQLLEDENFVRQADPEMLKIWQWHALEELERGGHLPERRGQLRQRRAGREGQARQARHGRRREDRRGRLEPVGRVERRVGEWREDLRAEVSTRGPQASHVR